MTIGRRRWHPASCLAALALVGATGCAEPRTADLLPAGSTDRVEAAVRVPPRATLEIDVEVEATTAERRPGGRAGAEVDNPASSAPALEVWAHVTDGPGRLLGNRELRPGHPERLELDLGELAGVRTLIGAAVKGAPTGAVVWHRARLSWGDRTPWSREPSLQASGERDRRPDVVVLLIDALRADVLRVFGGPIATPRLDRLAREGTRFTAAWSTSSWTRPATASLFTGHYPSTHRAEGRNNALPEPAFTLAERFRLLGYRTVGIIGNGNVDEHWGFDQGFEVYTGVPRDGDGGHPRADRIHREALERLEGLATPRQDGERAPLFLYVHTVDPHEPYAPPEWLLDGERPEIAADTSVLHDLNLRRRAATEELRRRLWRLYLGEVAWADRQAGQLLDSLSSRGLLDDAIVVVVSDHGEQFAEHGTWGHGITLYEEEVRVPLILWGPGRVARGAHIDVPVSIVDVAPTLLALLGRPDPSLPGRDLSAAGSDGRAPPAGPILAELDLDGTHRKRALRLGTWKLIHDRRRGRHSLFHLGVDPQESRDRFDADAPLPRRLVTLLESWTQDLRASALADAPVVAPGPDRELIESLRALGYLR